MKLGNRLKAALVMSLAWTLTGCPEEKSDAPKKETPKAGASVAPDKKADEGGW